jgi:hypothetical protein
LFVEAPGDPLLMLYKYGDKWIIGHNYNSENGIAYTSTAVESASIIEIASTREWYILSYNENESEGEAWTWVSMEFSLVVAGRDDVSIYPALFAHHTVSSFNMTSSLRLRNNLLLPAVGLGQALHF